MRILIVGKGHVGSYLRDRFDVPDDLFWTEDMDGLSAKVLAELDPDVVVNAAGKTDLAWCEREPLECFRCNVSAPVHLRRRVVEKGALFFQLSSGCVWDGPYAKFGRPFGPNDPPTPACFYAWTKVACDNALLADGTYDVVILRPRQIYSGQNSPRNTLVKLLGYDRLIHTPNSMTSIETIARAITKCLCAPRRPSLLNVYDLGVVSPFAVGEMLAAEGLRAPPVEMGKGDLDSWHKPKRVDVVLRDDEFSRLVRPPNVYDELKRMIGALKAELGGSQ